MNGILDDVDFLGEKPAKKTQYELADEKERTLKVVNELGGECTIYNFIDKYYELYGEKLSERTVRRKFKNADLVQKRLEGQKKVYGSGTDN